VRRVIAGAAALVAMAAVAPGAEAAKTYRFKLDVSVLQTTGWTAHFREQSQCGEDYHRDYDGAGAGTLKGRLRGGRIAFRERGGLLQSTPFKIRGSRHATNEWTVQWVGAPDGTCPPNLPAAEAPDTSDCGTRAGVLDSQLFVQGGRLALLTAFERAGNPSTPLCSDPTAVSVTGSKPRPKRRGVDDLIRNRRVRSIELTASLTDESIAGKNLNLPTGGTTLLSGGGNYDARWTVKLTRITG
jgi:hypothetical protein